MYSAHILCPARYQPWIVLRSAQVSLVEPGNDKYKSQICHVWRAWINPQRGSPSANARTRVQSEVSSEALVMVVSGSGQWGCPVAGTLTGHVDMGLQSHKAILHHSDSIWLRSFICSRQEIPRNSFTDPQATLNPIACLILTRQYANEPTTFCSSRNTWVTDTDNRLSILTLQ